MSYKTCKRNTLIKLIMMDPLFFKMGKCSFLLKKLFYNDDCFQFIGKCSVGWMRLNLKLSFDYYRGRSIIINISRFDSCREWSSTKYFWHSIDRWYYDFQNGQHKKNFQDKNTSRISSTFFCLYSHFERIDISKWKVLFRERTVDIRSQSNHSKHKDEYSKMLMFQRIRGLQIQIQDPSNRSR